MVLERFNIYTLKGRAILERAKKEMFWDEAPMEGMSYSIDLSNDFERMQLLKNEDDIDKEDTALFYQIREVLNAKEHIESRNKKNAHEDVNCLSDKIFIVDFENLFSHIGELGENKYLQYKKEVFKIKEKRDKALKELIEMSGFGDSDYHNIVEREYPMPKAPKFGYTEMIHFMFEYGIEVIFNGKARNYVPFDKSQSMARNSKITFIEVSLMTDVNTRLLLGSKQVGSFYLSKYYSYKGLYLSSGKRISSTDVLLDEETVVVLPDGPVYPGDDESVKRVAIPNVKYITNNEELGVDGEVIIEPEKTETIIIDSVMDGEGIISMDYSEKINTELWGKEEKNKATSFQIRMPFIKGMVHSMDINGFLDEFCEKEAEQILIKDCFGIERDLRKAKLIITQSMYKAYVGEGKDWFSDMEKKSDSEDPIKNYFRGFKQYNHALYISGTNLPYKNRCVTTLNYQFLNTLKLKEEELSNLIDKHMYYVNYPVEYLKRNTFTFNLKADEKTCDNEASGKEENTIDSDMEVNNKKIENESKEDEGKLKNEVPSWITVLLNNEESIHNPYIKEKVEAMKKSLIKDIGYGRILVKGEVRYLSRDILYFLHNILKHIKDIKIEEERMKTLSKEIENLEDCFYMPANKIGLVKKQHYPILRSPHLSRNEQCVLKAFKPTKNSLRYKYLGHLEGVVMVAYNSLAPDILGGADFDGDIVKVFAADELRNAVLRGVYGMESDYKIGKNYKRKLPIVRITPLKSQNAKIKGWDMSIVRVTPRVDYVTIYNTFSNKVGQISNLAIRIGEQQYWSGEKIEDNNVCCEMCTILTGLEIDACKTGIHPKFDSILKSINGNKGDYLTYFKTKLDKLQYMTWNNFETNKTKTNKTKTTYKYKVQNKSKFKAESGSTYILQQLAFEFMKRATEYSENLEDKTKVDYVLFEFEKNQDWEKQFKKDKIQKIKNLLKAHQYATKLVRNYNKKFLAQNQSKWRYKILKVWLSQDKGSREYIIEYGAQYLKILSKIQEYIKKDGDSYLEKLKNSEWPYLYYKKDKIEFLEKIFDIPKEELDQTLIEKLCDFSDKGYNLLYLFLREAQNTSVFMSFEDAVEKHKNKEEVLFEDKSKELENKQLREYLDDMLKKVYEDKGDARQCLSSYLKEQIGDNSFELMYYVSKNTQILRDYFWEYYSSEEVEKRIRKGV